MAKNQRGRGRRWTDGEVALLKELYPECPLPEISKRLNRTVGAIENRAHQLGIKRKTYLDKLWTAEELQLLRELYPISNDIQYIAKRVGRSPSTIRAKAHSLGFVKRRRTYDL
ncbi:MAG TPA: hypothetical protein HPP87_09090 [Planctomycetes bacterium]|nr:hypothetical protein [Planctomycetota bacterium]